MIFFGHPARHRFAAWLLVAAVLLAKGGTLLRAQTPADGSPRWLNGFSTGGWVVSSPAIGPDGTVYVGIRSKDTSSIYFGSVIAIKPDGSTKWQTLQLSDWVTSSPAVANDTIYIGCWNGKLYAFNASTGVKRWEYDTHFSITNSSPAVGPDGTIYVGSGDGALHAVSAAGTPIWSHPVGDVVDSSPAVGPDGTIYFGSTDNNVYAVNPDNSEKWHYVTGGDVNSSPAIGADGTVYIGSDDGKLYALTSEGKFKWAYPTDGPVQASPAIGPDGTIYVGSYDQYFYAINSDGSLKWHTTLGGKATISSAAVRADGIIIVGSDDHNLRAVNPIDGTFKWTQPTGDLIESSPVIAPDGSIYVGSLDGKVYAFNGNRSPGSTYSSWPMFRHDAVHSGRRDLPSVGGWLVNLSTRAVAGGGANLIAGLTVIGTAQKNFFLRGVGPTLAQPPFNVSGVLTDPRLALYAGQIRIAENDNWGSDGDAAQIEAVRASLAAFALPSGSKDATMLTSLVPGAYTAQITSVDGSAGVALAEAYDGNSSDQSTRLINLATRAQAGTGDNVLTAGLVIGGNGTLRVLLRAVGPGLADFGVPKVLALPSMTVFSGQTVRGTNTGWTSGGLKADLAGAASAVGAFALKDGSADSAMLLTLNSGAYTFQVSGVGGTTGEVIVEVYVVP